MIQATLFVIFLAVTMRLFLFAIKFGKARRKLAERQKLFDIFLNCSFCNGFWTGVVTYLIFLLPNYVYSGLNTAILDLVALIYVAVAVGAISLVLEKLLNYLDRESDIYTP